MLMLFALAADIIMLLHAAFILFVLFGALLIFRFRPLVLLHLPAAIWGIVSEWRGLVCPLTPLENRFRALAHQTGYRGGFIDHYILPLIYPAGLTRNIQFVLGAIVLVLNLLFYGYYAYIIHKR